MLFCVWEDARVWAYWNCSFDKHLGYLGPVSCFSPSWIPLGYTVGVTVVVEGLAVGSPFVSILSSLRAHHLGAVVAWWLQYPLFTDTAGNIFSFTAPSNHTGSTNRRLRQDLGHLCKITGIETINPNLWPDGLSPQWVSAWRGCVWRPHKTEHISQKVSLWCNHKQTME